MIELRTGTLNVSPIGRSCTIEEREEFFLLDKQQGIRRRLLEDLRRDFGERFGLSFALGGQISIDIYPTGWDKGLVLTVLGDRFNEYKESFFAGDNCAEDGGNDYALYSNQSINHRFWVKGPEETLHILRKELGDSA